MKLTIELPDDTAERLVVLAQREYRTTEAQASWLIQSALTGRLAARASREAQLAAMRPVTAELNRLHRQAGMPSSRKIAAMTGGKISHTTANAVLGGTVVPSWAVLVWITQALGGDVAVVRRLWADARSPQGGELPCTGPGSA
jgi:predicted transcriptional regulator